LDTSIKTDWNRGTNRSLPPTAYRQCRAESSPVGLARFEKNAVPKCTEAVATKFRSHDALFNAKFELFDYFRLNQYFRTIRTMVTLYQAQKKSIGRTQGCEDLDVLEEAVGVFWRGTVLDLCADENESLGRDVGIPAFHLLAKTFVYGTLVAINIGVSLEIMTNFSVRHRSTGSRLISRPYTIIASLMSP
jgi:hypothetical protein